MFNSNSMFFMKDSVGIGLEFLDLFLWRAEGPIEMEDDSNEYFQVLMISNSYISTEVELFSSVPFLNSKIFPIITLG